MGETGRKIYGYFKRLFGRRAEVERRIALLEISCDRLREQYGTLEEALKRVEIDVGALRTVSARTTAEEIPPSPAQVIDEWLNGEEAKDE